MSSRNRFGLGIALAPWRMRLFGPYRGISIIVLLGGFACACVGGPQPEPPFQDPDFAGEVTDGRGAGSPDAGAQTPADAEDDPNAAPIVDGGVTGSLVIPFIPATTVLLLDGETQPQAKPDLDSALSE